MKQRIFSGLIIALVAGILLFASGSIVFPVVVSLLSVMALYEMLSAAKYTKDTCLLIVCSVFAVAVPFFSLFKTYLFACIAVFLFILLILLLMLARWNKGGIEKIGFAFMMTVLLPAAYSSLIGIRDLYLLENSTLIKSDGTFLLLLTLLGSWGSDVGGLFAGSLFGKHKLAPSISPKKTVEGAIGGVLFSIIGFVLASVLYVKFYAETAKINFIFLIILAVLCTVGAIIGDLCASAAKRSFHVKDFGNLIPGHGGILDRFDSVLLVGPIIFLFIQIAPLINR